jgi:Bacteriophage minor capsid protein
MALLDELGAYLQSHGVAAVGSTLFKGSFPLDTLENTAPILALIEVPGLPPVRSHDVPVARYEQPVVQVATRGAPYGYPAARAAAQAAWDVLDGVQNTSLSGTFYLWLQALQSPYWLRTDDFQRPVLLFNVRCARAF